MNLLRAIIVALVALSALPAPAATVAVYGATNDVKAIDVTDSTVYPQGTSILRNGFYEPGDSPETHYWLRRSNCLINGGAGDDGVEIKPTAPVAGVCWVANTPPTDPLVWGAKCNGSNDDTTAIQKAIDYAQSYVGAAVTVKGSVVLPAGRICRVKAGLQIRGAIDFGGAGRYDGKLAALDDATGPVIRIFPEYFTNIDNQPIAQVRIHNMQIQGVPCGSGCDSNSALHGIELFNPPPTSTASPCVSGSTKWPRMMVRIEDVDIIHAKGSGISAKCNFAAGAVTLNNVSISYAYDGVHMEYNFDWTIYSLKVNGSSNNAFYAKSPVNLTCVDCELFTSHNAGLYLLDEGNDARFGNVTFIGGAIDYNRWHGLYWDVRGPLGINLIGTHFTSNGRDPNQEGTPTDPERGSFSDVYFASGSNIIGLKIDNAIFNYAPYLATPYPEPNPNDKYHTAKNNIEFGPNVTGSLSLNAYFAASLDKAVSNPERVFGSSTSYTEGQYFNYEVTTFTASGPYKPRTNLEEASVVLFGCGGGGGSGARDATDKIISGGGGGGGGARADGRFKGVAIGAEQQITICTPGSGGAAQGTNATGGNTGAAGGATTFGSLLYAWGGGRGAGGGLAIASGGGAGGGALGPGGNGSDSAGGTVGVGGAAGGNNGAAGASNASFGGGGGAGSPVAGGAGLTGGAAPYGGGGGGGAGGGLAANAGSGSSGGAGAPLWNNTFPAGGGNCAAGGTGLNNNSGAYDKGGSGGAGGGSCLGAAAGAGGSGGFPAGGGGGGGASRNGFASGDGGVGGAGLAVVVSKYKN